LHARVDSSDSELDVRPAPLGSPAAVVSAARQRRAFVRLVGGLWPFPLRSASTYACLGGMLILSLVVVDELATTLRRQHHDEAAAHSSSERRGSEPELLHILRHSFLYRLALCASFLVVVFVHGLVVHKGRASSRRRRDNNNALSEGGANPSSPMTYAGVVRKSVSFAHRSGGESSGAEESPALRPLGASVAAAAMISLAPSARPATRKRLQLFFALALLLALCGVAFEVYLAVVSHGSNEAVVIPVKAAPSASAVAEAWWSSLGAAVSNLWASCSLSLLTRGLLLLVWCAACGLLSYYAWYRKAIGTRKSRGPLKRNRAAAQLEDVAEATTDEESDGQDDSEAEEETAQRKISEDEEVVAEAVAAASLSSAAASSSGTPAAASSVSHSPPPVVVAPLDSDSAAGAFLLASDSESEEELDSEDDGGLAAAGLLPAGGGHKRKDSSAMGGRPASFPVPSTAELLLAEKLDASLFFHPEQIQNQWKQGPNGTLLSSSSHTPQHLGSSSATIAPPPGGRDHKSLSASPATMPLHSRAVHRRASDSGKVHTPVAPSPATPAAAHISPPGVAGPSVAASSASPSTGSGSSSASPSFALPLSTHASSPLNIATLFHLASTKFIASLSQADFHNILPEMEWISVAEGEDVFKRGERYHTPPPTQQQPAQQDQQPHATTPSNPSQQQQPQRDGMFIVVSGTVGALNPSNPTQLLHTAHQGDSFGELEFLFSHLSRSVTMRALTPVQLLRIPTSLGRIWNAGGAFSFSGGAITGGNGNASADDVAASARPLAASSETESVLPFVGPSGTPGSTVVQTAVNEELRSDILLSFIRTTLARQWRSAQFILDHFLHIPLDDEYVIAMRPPSPVAAGGAAAALASSAVSSTPASRYFSPQFASFFPEDSLLLRSMTERASAQVELSANQMLFEEGTYRSDQLFVVLSGSVQLTSTRDAAMHHGAASSSASASPPSSTGCTAPMILGPGSVLNAVAYFTDTTQTHTCKAAAEGVTRVAWLNRADLAVPDAEILRLAQLVCAVLAPTLAQYQALGFQRLWIRAGTLVFAEGEACESLHVISSGRVRIVTGKMKRRKRRTSVSTPVQSAPTSSNPSPYQRASSATPSSTAAAFLHPSGIDLTPFTEAHKYASTLNTAGGGVGTGVVSSNGASTAGTTPRIKFELVAGEMVGELSFFNGIGDGDDFHPQPNASSSSKASPTHGSTALCTKDTELLKISRACFANLSRLYPRTLMKLLAIVSQRMRNMMAAHSSGEGMSSTGSKQASVLSSIPRSPFLRTPTSGGSGACCSVCLLTSSPSVPLQDFALNLSVSLSQHGRTMLLTPLHVDRVLGEGTCANLNSYAVRSLLAYWLAHVEQHYAFCLFVCDSQVSAWTRQCTRQADLTLIIANADNTKDAASNSNGGSAVSEIDTDTDGDDDEVEDDEESPEALARIRRRRLAACRRTAVSRFERAVVWDESPVVTDANSFRNKLPCAELGVCEPSGRTPKKHASAATSRSLSAAFSPTLRPSPPPRDASSSVPTASSLVASTGGNGTPATLRATGNYSRCAPRMNFALRDLVLLHPPTTVLPRGTRFWFGARPQLHRFHHVQLGCAEHMDRLARYVAGKSIGVVLSGGGARGLAHLGVLQSFAEQQVPVDYIGGTSQGSFMGALYASQAQHHPAALSQMRVRTHALAERMGSIKSLLSDATFPMLSYFAGAKFGANIRELLGGRTRIEDLWIPFFLSVPPSKYTRSALSVSTCTLANALFWSASVVVLPV
jgi:CRP-like cAMP-binding protein